MAENLDCGNLLSRRPLFSGWTGFSKVTRYDLCYLLFIVVHSFFKAAQFKKAKVSAVAVNGGSWSTLTPGMQSPLPLEITNTSRTLGA